jgi:ankyrin repeat protein
MPDELRIHEAFQNGDLEAVALAVGEGFPSCRLPFQSTSCLEYAIYHSPLPFIARLLALGADPNYESEGGFPSLIAALSTEREDRYRLLELLIGAGADLNQRGVNDWTPLHYAASQDDAAAIELLVAKGADLNARSGIDDYATPLEEAENLGRAKAVKALSRARQG